MRSRLFNTGTGLVCAGSILNYICAFSGFNKPLLILAVIASMAGAVMLCCELYKDHINKKNGEENHEQN